MEKAVKYTFSEDFEAAPTANSKADAEAARTAELETIRSAAYADGHKDGLAEATQKIDAANQQILTQIDAKLATLGEGWAALETSVSEEAAKLAHSIGLQLAKELISKQPLKDVEALIGEALTLCMGEPRLVIRINAQALEALKDKIESLSQQSAFPGKVILLGEDSLGPSDCLIEWADGGIERRIATIEDDIHTLIRRYLDAGHASAQGGQDDV